MGEVVVLGPTGNIGSRLIHYLLARGISVRTGNRADFDYFQPSTYFPLFRGATHLFLLTPLVENMVSLTSGLLRAAKLAGIERIVRISAFGADKKSTVSIFRLHGETEELVRQSGIPFTIIRPNALMQNFIHFYAHSIKNRSLLALPVADSRISFVDAQDVARVSAGVLVDPSFTGEAIEVTGPQALSFKQACQSLSSVLGREVRFVDADETAARANMIQAGVPPWRVETTLELYASYRRAEGERVTHAVSSITQSEPRKLSDFFTTHREEWK